MRWCAGQIRRVEPRLRLFDARDLAETLAPDRTVVVAGAASAGSEYAELRVQPNTH